ncbi:MAG: ATP-dependent helicase [Opitutales bacterium]|nr:ATP-dependent helicase [Opitutales bacterium]
MRQAVGMLDFSPIDYKAELNEEQFAAVTAPPGPALVLAGAGSGKTRTLTYRVAYLMLEKRVSPQNILLLTFTNKAAREMIQRVMELTGAQYPPSYGGTFHSIGGRLLRRFGRSVGIEPNYNILDQGDAEALMSSIIKELDPGYLKNKDNPKPNVVSSIISYSINTDTALREVVRQRYPWGDAALTGRFEKFAKVYRERKLQLQVADYDDLLYYWLKMLKEDEETRNYLREKFQYILVDEYQDTNIMQSEIIDLIGHHHNIMAVGDDAQCIYTWRGAVFENIRAFPDRHPGTRIYKIVRNYRSSPQILSLANKVLEAQPATAGYFKELVAAKEDNLTPYVVPLLDSVQQGQFLAQRIQGLYDEGYALKDIAVLYRAHYQAVDAQLELTRAGVPFVITSGVRFFEQAHIRDFIAQLRVINNPSDKPAFERLLGLLPRVGPATVEKILKAADLEREKARRANISAEDTLFETAPTEAGDIFSALLKPTVVAKVPADAKADFKQLAQTLCELNELFEDGRSRTSAARLVQRGIDGWYGDYILTAYSNGEERREDLEGLINFAEKFDTLSEFLSQVVLLNSETSNRSVDPDEDTVRMTTVHQAKGLEYPVVFVLGCAEDLFPLKRAVESGSVDEERRLFYVAVTRAMDQLYLCFPMMNKTRGGAIRTEPSRFLTELPPDCYEKVGFRPTRY